MFALASGRWGESPHQWEFKNIGDFCPGSRIVLPADGDMSEGWLRPDLAEWLDGHEHAELLLLTISGSDWLNHCLSVRPEPFDIIVPGRPDLPEIPNTRLIPYAEMKAMMRARIRHILLGLKLVAERARIPVVYVEPPPPIEDNEHLARTAPWEADAIEERGVTSPWLRLKMYLLQSELIAEACEESGVDFHRVPDTARTVDGFMTPEGVANDPFHATGTWGARVMADFDARY